MCIIIITENKQYHELIRTGLRNINHIERRILNYNDSLF